jgi:uncharacterized repeat protein (TIGR01451 family)
MKILHTITNKLSHKLTSIIVIVLLLAASIVPLVTSNAIAADQVTMEGHVKSLNSTKAETEYKEETNLMVDEVAQIQLWHHNRQAPGSTAATNTTVKFTVPTAQGKSQVVTGSSSSDNGNTITDTTTINLTADNARLQYIPGSAKFRYNKGAVDGVQSCITGMEFPAESCYSTVSISDEVVAGGVNLDEVRGAPLHGCNAYHETIIIQVRSLADGISVNKYVRHLGEEASDWATSTTAKPGDKLEYLIRFKNEGNTQLEDVMVGDNLPKYNSYVTGSTMLSNSNHPDGISANNDNITKGGIDVGNYTPGAVGYVWFTAQLDNKTAYEKCGQYEVVNVGVVRAKGMNEFYNTASVKINVECETPEPIYICENFTLTLVKGRNYKFEVKARAEGGAKIKHYEFTFGDNSEVLKTDKTVVEHEYQKDGTFVANVKVTFDVNGSLVTVGGEGVCSKGLTFKQDKPMCELPGKGHLPKDSPECKATTTVTTLPKTGAGSVAGLMAAVSVAGTALHRRMTLRKNR